MTLLVTGYCCILDNAVNFQKISIDFKWHFLGGEGQKLLIWNLWIKTCVPQVKNTVVDVSILLHSNSNLPWIFCWSIQLCYTQFWSLFKTVVVLDKNLTLFYVGMMKLVQKLGKKLGPSATTRVPKKKHQVYLIQS